MPPKSYYSGRKSEKRKVTPRGSTESSSVVSDGSSGGTVSESGSGGTTSSPGFSSGGGGSFLGPLYSGAAGSPGMPGASDISSVLMSSYQEILLSPVSKCELQRLYEEREALEQRLLEQDVNVYFSESLFYRVCCELGGSLFSDCPGTPYSTACYNSDVNIFARGSGGSGGVPPNSFPDPGSSFSSAAAKSSGNVSSCGRLSVGGVGPGNDGSCNIKAMGERGPGGGGNCISLASLGIPAPFPSSSLDKRWKEGGTEEGQLGAEREVNDPSYLFCQCVSPVNLLEESSNNNNISTMNHSITGQTSASAGLTTHLGRRESSEKAAMYSHHNNNPNNRNNNNVLHPHFLYTCHAYNARLHQFSPAERFFSSSSIGAIGRVEGFLSKASAAGNSLTAVRDELKQREVRGGGKRGYQSRKRGRDNAGVSLNNSHLRRSITAASSSGVTSVESISSAFSPGLPFALSCETMALGLWAGGGGCGSGGGGLVDVVSSTSRNTGTAPSRVRGWHAASSSDPSSTREATATTATGMARTSGGGGGVGGMNDCSQGGARSSSFSSLKYGSTSTTYSGLASSSQPTTTTGEGGTGGNSSSSASSSGAEVRQKSINIDERTGKRPYRRRVPLASASSPTVSCITARNDAEDDRGDDEEEDGGGGSALPTKGRRRAGREQAGKEVEEEVKVRETRKYTKRARN